MSLQAIGQDGRLYSQERDIAHNFGWLVQFVLKRMDERPWATVEQYLRDQGVTDPQIAEGMDKLVELMLATKGTDRPMMEVMNEVGWLDVNPHVHVALCAYIGSAMIGAYYQGIQEATLLDDDPTKRLPNLRVTADKACRVYKKTGWGKLFYYAWQETLNLFKRKK